MIKAKPNNNELNPDPYYSDVQATFGDRLCAARDAAGLNQSMLAEKIGVKLKTVQAWESDSVEPRANKLRVELPTTPFVHPYAPALTVSPKSVALPVEAMVI